jgi:hypothetical protein
MPGLFGATDGCIDSDSTHGNRATRACVRVRGIRFPFTKKPLGSQSIQVVIRAAKAASALGARLRRSFCIVRPNRRH